MIVIMEKKSQLKHIESILTLIFQNEAQFFSINVYLKSEILPAIFENIHHYNYEQIVVLELNENIPQLEEKVVRFSKLLSKPIEQEITGNKIFLYWFEGLQNDMYDDGAKRKSKLVDIQIIEKIKSETRLPKWLDNYIFHSLQAKYEPDFEKFDYNLEHSTEELIVYLGTYFPRSFSESFCIFDDLFSNRIYNLEVSTKNEFSILDIGCGTGGNLIGLLTAINKYFSNIRKINIWAIDGNSDALQILESIINQFAINYSINIAYNLLNKTFRNINEISNCLDNIPCKFFDFIMCFKTIVEVISKGNGLYNDSYYNWLDLTSDLLNSSGLELIVDVTTKTDYSDYLPLLLNEQSRKFVKANPLFKILSPLSCNYYSHTCNNHCFYQQEFYVSHRQKNKDASRIAYKIIGRAPFVDKILNERKKGKFVINWKQHNIDLPNSGICINSIGGDILIDSYKIS